MASVVDITDKALYEVFIDWDKLIDKDFMMGIFDGITKKLPPLQEYLDFMFESKQSSLVGPCKEEERFCHGIYCNINCFILPAKIFSILPHFY